MSDAPPPPPPYLPPPAPSAAPSPVYAAAPPPPPAPPGFGGRSPLYPSSFQPDQPPTRSGKATAAFVLGLASIVLFFLLVVPILAIVFGLLGAKEIKRSGGRKRGMAFARIGWIFGVVTLLGGVVLWTFVALDIASTTSVFDLKAGDCVEKPDDGDDSVSRLQTFDCTDAHGAEVFMTGELPGGDRPYPGVTEVISMVSAQCIPGFEDYVGVPLGQSDLEAFPIYPTEDHWDENQQFVCLAYDPNNDLTEPIEGAQR